MCPHVRIFDVEMKYLAGDCMKTHTSKAFIDIEYFT